MNKFTKITAVLFVMFVAIIASLFVFGAVTRDLFTDSVAKVGIVSLIAIVASFVISLFDRA